MKIEQWINPKYLIQTYEKNIIYRIGHNDDDGQCQRAVAVLQHKA